MVLVSCHWTKEEGLIGLQYTKLNELFDTRYANGAYDFQSALSCITYAILSIAKLIHTHGADKFKDKFNEYFIFSCQIKKEYLVNKDNCTEESISIKKKQNVVYTCMTLLIRNGN